MHVDANGGNGTTIEKMITKMGIATRLVKRISTRSRGMREASLLRLLQAFVVSHVAYVGAFHQWKAQERERIDAAIRKSYRAALGLLNGTSNAALLSLGVHNTLAEISEAQRVSQLERLGSTTSGRKILQRVGLRPPLGPAAEDELVPLRDDIARRIIVPPLPRNVDPERNVERRSARARALARTYNEDEGAVFVDAAKHRERADTFVVVVLKATSGELLNAGSVRAATARQAEEAAIALALTLPGTRTVLSDSKSAISNFARGTVCRSTARLLSRIREGAANSTSIRWFPAHAGRELPNGHHNRNEEADAAARVLATCRTAPPASTEPRKTPGRKQTTTTTKTQGSPSSPTAKCSGGTDAKEGLFRLHTPACPGRRRCSCGSYRPRPCSRQRWRATCARNSTSEPSAVCVRECPRTWPTSCGAATNSARATQATASRRTFAS